MDEFIKIPKALLKEKELKPIQMILFGLIRSLSAKKGYCYASNKTLGEYLNLSVRSVQNHLRELQDKGYVEKCMGGGKNLHGGVNRFAPKYISIIDKEDISNKLDISKKEKMFELFWKQYPHYRQGKKQESKNFFLKQDPDKVLKQAAVYKRQVLSGIKDRQFVPACQRWIRDFTELSDEVIQQDLKQVVKRHLGAEGDKHDRYEKLKQDFPDVNFNEIAKEISREKGLIKMTFT